MAHLLAGERAGDRRPRPAASSRDRCRSPASAASMRVDRARGHTFFGPSGPRRRRRGGPCLRWKIRSEEPTMRDIIPYTGMGIIGGSVVGMLLALVVGMAPGVGIAIGAAVGLIIGAVADMTAGPGRAPKQG